MKALALASFTAASLFTLAIPAAAHSILVTPPPIGQDDAAKSGPCGCYFGGAPQDPADDPSPAPCPGDYQVTTLTAGAPLKIQWKETINHDGKFRFAFSTKTPDAATKADMDEGVLVEIDDANATAGASLSQMVTVPNEPCELCTIQLRQLMVGAANPYYYSCAAVKIVAPDPGTGGGGSGGGATSTGAGASSSGGSGQGASGQGGAPFSTGAGKAEPQPEIKASCAISLGSKDSSALSSIAIVALSIASMFARKRRRA